MSAYPELRSASTYADEIKQYFAEREIHVNNKQKVLQAIQSDDLTIGQIHDCTGIDRGTIEIILQELKRDRVAAISVDKTWRGMLRGRDFGGYAK